MNTADLESFFRLLQRLVMATEKIADLMPEPTINELESLVGDLPNVTKL